MRPAKARDYWRAIQKGSSDYSVRTISIEGVPGLEDQRLDVDSRMFALCGPNGSFKSSLLNSFYAALCGAPAEAFKSRLSDADIRVELCRGGDVETRQFPSVGEEVSEATFLDGSADIYESVRWVRGLNNVDELLEAYGASHATKEERENISYACGKEYKSVEFYELEEVDGCRTMPFFSVQCRDASYDSRTMGFGEYGIFFTYWLFRRCAYGSIVFLEEPENYIPPRAQWALMDVIAKLCVQRGLILGVTTHSEHIIGKIPRGSVFYMRKGVEGYVAAPVSKDASHLRSIGISPVKRDVLLVEDFAAKQFLLAILNEFEERVYPSFDVAVSGSVGDTEVILERFPAGGHSVRIIGVHDADEGELKVKGQPSAWWRVFLPGTGSPEEEVKKALESDVRGASNVFGVEVERLAQALDLVEGLDLHEFPNRLAEFLNIPVERVWASGVKCWLRVGNFREESEALVDMISGVFHENRNGLDHDDH